MLHETIFLVFLAASLLAPLSTPLSVPALAMASGLCMVASLLLPWRPCKTGFALMGLGLAAWILVLNSPGAPSLGPECPHPPADIVASGLVQGHYRMRMDSASRWRGAKQEVYAQLTHKLCALPQGNVWLPQQGRIKLKWGDDMQVARGDALQAQLLIKPLPPALNPQDFSPALRRRRQHITGNAVVLGQPARLRSSNSWTTYCLKSIDRLRQHLAGRIEQSLPISEAALVKALTIGDKSSLKTMQMEAWADCGIAHLLAVSGLHIGLVAWLVAWLTEWLLLRIGYRFELGEPRTVAMLLAMVVSGFYCLLTGAGAASLRAILMVSMAYLGFWQGVGLQAWQSLMAAGWLLLWFSPNFVWDWGFIFSFATVAALLLYPIAPFGSWSLRFFGHALGMGVWVVLFTLPLQAAVWGRVSLVAPLVNLLALPWGAWLATPAALLHSLVAAIHLNAAAYTAYMVHATIGLLDQTTQWLAQSQNLAINCRAPNYFEWIAFVMLVGLVRLRRQSGAKAIYAAATIMAAVMGQWLILHFDALRHPELVVRHVYIGQGDATWITLPHGATWLIDGGGNVEVAQAVPEEHFDPGRMILAPMLRRSGVRSIDVMVATHPHPDHFAGLLYIAEHFPTRELWWNGEGGHLPAMQALFKAVQRSGGRVRRADTLPQTLWQQGVELQVAPVRSSLAALKTAENDRSIVLRMRYGQRSILLTGDIEQRAEKLLQPWLSSADILKVGHHGSKTASSLAFLKKIHPDVAVISSGLGNLYGLPHAQTLQRLEQLGIRTLRTDRDGMVVFHTSGQSWRMHKTHFTPSR